MQQERASKKQIELLTYIDGSIQANGYGPSYREIMNALGYKSVSTVAVHINGLIAKGYLTRRDKSARSLEVISLTTPEQTIPQGAASDAESQIIERINRVTLNNDQKECIRKSMELLGFERAALSAEGHHEKNS